MFEAITRALNLDYIEVFGSATTALTPDYIKIKARFFPVITIDPKKESPISKILQPKIFLVKGDNILMLDPITKTLRRATPQELKQTGMTIIDFAVFGAVLLLLYQGIKLSLKKAKIK